MINVNDIFKELKSTNGKKDKENILLKNQDNKLMHDVLVFLLNDFVTTGISKKKISKDINENIFKHIPNEIENVEGLFKYLKYNNTGRDIDIFMINKFINKQPEELQNTIKEIVCKSLKLGLSAKTHNKLFKDSKIPVFEVMLAKKFGDFKEKTIGKEVVISKKLDGTRIIVIKHNGKVKSFTRQGKEYIGLQQIENEVKNIDLDNFVLDGELLSGSNIKNTQELFADTLKKSRTKEENKTGLVFNTFDFLTYDEFQSGKSKTDTSTRKVELKLLHDSFDFKYIKNVENLYKGELTEEILEEMILTVRKNGWEGVMIQLANSKYECKRTSNLLKVKEMLSSDLKIVGFEQGEGRNKDTLGAIVCEYKDNTVKAGSGYSDVERDEVWNNQSIWINRVIEVSHFGETKDSKTGLRSLRFPVFKCLREEGKEVSY